MHTTNYGSIGVMSKYNIHMLQLFHAQDLRLCDRYHQHRSRVGLAGEHD